MPASQPSPLRTAHNHHHQRQPDQHSPPPTLPPSSPPSSVSSSSSGTNAQPPLHRPASVQHSLSFQQQQQQYHHPQQPTPHHFGGGGPNAAVVSHRASSSASSSSSSSSGGGGPPQLRTLPDPSRPVPQPVSEASPLAREPSMKAGIGGGGAFGVGGGSGSGATTPGAASAGSTTPTTARSEPWGPPVMSVPGGIGGSSSSRPGEYPGGGGGLGNGWVSAGGGDVKGLDGGHGVSSVPGQLPPPATFSSSFAEDELELALRRSPFVLSLVSRIGSNEQSINSITSQLSTLNAALASLLPSGGGGGGAGAASSANSANANSGSTLRPLSNSPELRQPGGGGGVVSGGDNASTALLTSQVLALSSSVAQLQALAVQRQNPFAVMGGPPPPSARGGVESGLLTPGGGLQPSAAGMAPSFDRPGGGAGLFNLVLPTPKGSTTPSAASSAMANSPFSNGNGGAGTNGAAPLSPRASKIQGGSGGSGRGPPPGSMGARPGLGRSFSTPYGVGGRYENNDVGPMTSVAGGGGGWPLPSPGQVTPGGSGGGGGGGSSLGPGAAHNLVKWDQVGLVPELLRGVLKYGIGPPNKVQQRALPFLLRGNDIIAQAPPTQERIIAYVVPAINICLSYPLVGPYRGPQIVIVTTTVDQATQAYKLVRDLATPLGVRSSLCVGPLTALSATGAWIDELRMVAPAFIVGTPAKIGELFAGGKAAPPGGVRGFGLSGDGVRFLVIDEVDQLIARNLYEYVIEVVKRFPLPRSARLAAGSASSAAPGGPALMSPNPSLQSPFDGGASSPFNPSSNNPFPGLGSSSASSIASRRCPGPPTSSNPAGTIGPPTMAVFGELPSPGGVGLAQQQQQQVVDRQTCLFSNTVPQDVLNFASAIQVREPVRVLVRREGGGGGAGGGGGGGGGAGPINIGSGSMGGVGNGVGIGGSAGGASAVSTTLGLLSGGEPTTPGGQGGGGGGLKHLYLYLAFTSASASSASAAASAASAGTIGSGRIGGGGASSEANQAREWKLEALADLLEDETAVLPGVVYVGSESALEAVAYKLSTRGLEVTCLHPDLTPQARQNALAKFRGPSTTGRGKVLVAFDVHPKPGELGPHVKLVVNYDLPRSVEGYAQRVTPVSSAAHARPGVVINLIQANGGDVEMLRSIECQFRFKCSEVPVNLREAF